MSNLHTIPANTRLITEGDGAGSIYVVIDGELSVYIGNGEDKIKLAEMKRGDVVGEGGYFGQRRSASVDTLTASRLLRFDNEDQERLCVAYPSIASRVFLSLNQLQAQRLVESRSNDQNRRDRRKGDKRNKDNSTSFDSELH
jgi:CRP-like cAMP-binding protein